MRTKIFSLLVLLLVLVSCDPEKNREDQIAGTWTGKIMKVTDEMTLSGEISTTLRKAKTFTQRAEVEVNGIPVTVRASGTWELQGKYLLMKVKETSFGDLIPKGLTSSSEILELKGNTLILDEEEFGRVVYKK